MSPRLLGILMVALVMVCGPSSALLVTLYAVAGWRGVLEFGVIAALGALWLWLAYRLIRS